MIWLMMSLVIALDQVTKYYIEENMLLFESQPVIENIFYLTLLRNTGGAFGLFRDHIQILIALTLIMFLVLLLNFRRIPKATLWQRIALGLFLGGALSNFLDRVFRGYVVDFLNFQIWPVFNVADSAITVGVVIYCIYIFLYGRQEQLHG